MLIKALPALILVFFIWPLTLGAGLGLKKNIDRYIIGFCAVQALFYIVYIPAIVFSWSSRTLTYAAAIIITIVGVGGALARYNKASDRKEYLALTKPNFSYLKNPFFIGALLIIAYEMWIYAVKEPYIYGDDVTYMTLVTRFVDTNAIYTKEWSGQVDPTPLSDINFKYVFTSYYPFLGMISILTRLHPLILCKTVIPLIYLPSHYLITWRIGMYLFGDEADKAKRLEQQSLFMFFYAILIEFGHISYYTLSRRVTIWIYNSKSDCFCLLLIPLFFYTYLFLCEKEESGLILSNNKLWYRQLLITLVALACNSATLMGVMFSAITMVIWYIIASFRLKKPSLFLSCLWTLIPHVIELALLINFTGFSFISQ